MISKAFPTLALAASLLLASCVAPRERRPEPATPSAPSTTPDAPQPAPTPPQPATAQAAGLEVVPMPDVDPAQLGRTLSAFLLSCDTVGRRTDASGLTRPEDWKAVCGEYPIVDGTPALQAAYLRDNFEAVRVGDGAAFATGYYEPEILGSRTPGPGFLVPIYSKPPELVRGTFPDGKQGRGRLDPATGQHVLFYERAEIDAGALGGRGLEIGWAADPVELFFLQIQGSGRVRLPDGSVMRIGYADQNGREYVAIGKLLRDRGLVTAPVTAEAIKAWLRANPVEGRAIMNENKSYIFFSELTGPGPLGSIGVPVTGRATVAVDPRFVPYGAPVILSGMSQPEADGLWVAQDTGGAIKGPNRFDTFWGAGSEASRIAGGMQARGQALILLPKSAVARLRARPRP